MASTLSKLFSYPVDCYGARLPMSIRSARPHIGARSGELTLT